jgi:hypothetical protein
VKVCNPTPALKITAAQVTFLFIANVAETASRVREPMEIMLKFAGPVAELICPDAEVKRTVPLLGVKVPLLSHAPVIVRVKALDTRILPKLIVKDAQAASASITTEFEPEVAIMTASPATGTTPPTHVVVVAQFPPVEVLVIVAAFI